MEIYIDIKRPSKHSYTYEYIADMLWTSLTTTDMNSISESDVISNRTTYSLQCSKRQHLDLVYLGSVEVLGHTLSPGQMPGHLISD
jgi:hypothetical protein